MKIIILNIQIIVIILKKLKLYEKAVWENTSIIITTMEDFVILSKLGDEAYSIISYNNKMKD